MQKTPNTELALALPAGQLAPLLRRVAVSAVLAGLFVWLLMSRLGEINLAAVGSALSDVQAVQWGLALAATAVSFWAVGHYDAVVHRHFGTGVAGATARRAGVSAIAVSQTLGLGVITGAILRWRMLPGVSLALASKLTVAVAVSFLCGWAVVTAAVILVLPDAPLKPVAAGVAVAAAGMVVLVLAAPPRLRRHLPNLFTLTRLVVLAAVDTLAAALALYLLLPGDLALPLTVLVPAFLLALGAGLVSGTPGGVGAFEVTLLALLPPLPEEPLLAAILAWRLIYFAIPAVIGGMVAAFGPREVTSAAQDCPCHPARAETLIRHQGEHQIGAGGAWLIGQTPHLTVGLFDPLTAPGPALRALTTAAHEQSRLPAIYKCSARMAVAARANGWQTLQIAREAWLDPRAFQPSIKLRRGLRRAAAAGVTVTCTTTLPLEEMTRIAADWARTHGGERGFSMGRFAPDYVAGQRVYLALRGGRLIGFVTFQPGENDWSLDLMRHAARLPEGTMLALIAAAIAEAAAEGVPRLSLGAVPEAAFGGRRLIDRALRRFGCDGAGLLHFKSGFAPQWRPLYLAAPSRLALPVAAAGISRAIARPAPLQGESAQYEFASARRSWHRRGSPD